MVQSSDTRVLAPEMSGFVRRIVFNALPNGGMAHDWTREVGIVETGYCRLIRQGDVVLFLVVATSCCRIGSVWD